MTIDRSAFGATVGGRTMSRAVLAKAEDETTTARLARPFPKGFLWGAATAGHQTEGNNTNSDIWVAENVKPTLFSEPSGDAANSFELWPVDLDLIKSIGLNSYRFSLEWARIEPVEGRFSVAMLDHYKAMIEGCRARGLTPLVTFNHWTVPKWFAAKGAWLNPESPRLFARFCDQAMRHLGAHIGYATTLNEPDLSLAFQSLRPATKALVPLYNAMNAAAGNATGSNQFAIAFLQVTPDTAKMALRNMIAAHKAGRAAIKAVRPELPVGVSLSITDEEAIGSPEKRDQIRADVYGAWLDAARGDDFIGVQNYERHQWQGEVLLPAPSGVDINYNAAEVYPPSLVNAVQYANQTSGCPVMVTEHGVGTDDDTIRARLIPSALIQLQIATSHGLPVLGYMHWSLIDNYEWFYGYKRKFGLCSIDRTTFKRTPKPSAHVLGGIAKQNAV